jgi:hypothetical protein
MPTINRLETGFPGKRSAAHRCLLELVDCNGPRQRRSLTAFDNRDPSALPAASAVAAFIT